MHPREIVRSMILNNTNKIYFLFIITPTKFFSKETLKINQSVAQNIANKGKADCVKRCQLIGLVYQRRRDIST